MNNQKKKTKKGGTILEGVWLVGVDEWCLEGGCFLFGKFAEVRGQG